MDISGTLYTGWDHYRLADMLRLPQLRYGPCTIPSLPYKTEGHRYYDVFPTSLATRYLKLIGSHASVPGFHLPTLHRAVKQHPFRPTVTRDIVFHLRLGDICLADNDVRFKRVMTPRELCFHGLELQYNSSKSCFYIQPWKHYAQHLQNLSHTRATKNVILVGGSHRHDKGDAESKEIVRLYSLQLTKLGYSVTQRLGCNPDEDFIFMSYAPFFIAGGGGFAELITKYREYIHTIANH